MPIRFYCPLGHRLVVPDERAGKKGRCPQCRQKVYVPVADPRPSGQPKQPLAGEAIELDQAGDASPGVLDAPRAAAPGGSQGQLATATARRLSPAEKSPAAAPADPRDPLALALDEITAMQHDKDQAVVYMPRSEEPSSHSGSVSKWLPPPAAKAATGAAAAPGTSAVAVPPATPDPPGAGPAANLAPIAALPAAASGAMAPVRGWLRAAEFDEIDRAFRPDETRLQMMYLLAGALMLVALVSSWPALTHFRRNEAAPWIAIVLLTSAASLVYVVWLLSLADWSTLRVGMVLCAACAAVYACGLVIEIRTPDSQTIALGLAEVRSSAGLWCALQMGLFGAVCFGFERQASSWREEARGEW